MNFSVEALFCRVFVDPLISGLRRMVTSMISAGEKVIYIACGTGDLSLANAKRASHVTGIALSEDMIITARRVAARRRTENVNFDLIDATDLSCYPDKGFDTAVSTMAWLCTSLTRKKV